MTFHRLGGILGLHLGPNNFAEAVSGLDSRHVKCVRYSGLRRFDENARVAESQRQARDLERPIGNGRVPKRIPER